MYNVSANKQEENESDPNSTLLAQKIRKSKHKIKLQGKPSAIKEHCDEENIEESIL